MKNYLLSISILLSLVISTHSTQVLSEQATHSKKEFLGNMAKGLKNDFCAPDTFFRKCYSVSEKECIKTASTIVKACIRQEGPKANEALTEAEAVQLAHAILKCASPRYDTTMKEKRSHALHCEDPSYWK